MAESSLDGPFAALLQTADPFALDTTIRNLNELGGSDAMLCHLPLGTSNTSSNDDDDNENRPFLETRFNKIGENEYRSPWKQQQQQHPSRDAEVVELESTANEVWDAYRRLYYGNDAVGSVYVQRRASSTDNNNNNNSKKKQQQKTMEALFAMQKLVQGETFGEDGCLQEIGRWESAHRVTIEPSQDGTTTTTTTTNSCEYTIRSVVWCRYQPEDVGDVPKPKQQQQQQQKAPPKPKPTKPKSNARALDIARLELFDKAATNWDSHHSKDKNNKHTHKPAAATAEPIPAVVTSSAVYTMDTTKVCPISKSSGTAAQHIANIGPILETLEADLRSKLERFDAPKCFEVLRSMYRPTLSPGLTLSGVSRLGGHATGMGVGKGLIGEIALQAKSRGLGGSDNNSKAMESILAAEKQKLVADTANTTATAPDWKSGLKKSSTPSPMMMVPPSVANLRAGLKKPVAPLPTSTTNKAPTPEFLSFRNKLKSTTTTAAK